MNFPIAMAICSFFVLWVSARIGVLFRARIKRVEDDHEDFSVISGAVLTLLGLLIGFSFSMAISRYDQRKNYEEEEANAIGTEYVRADLLPSANASKTHELLAKYLDLRIKFYESRSEKQVDQINAETAQLENQLWSELTPAAIANPTPVMATVVTGMNDVLNRQGYTQAAWWNRIPTAAWSLMMLIAIGSNLLLGYGMHRKSEFMFLIVPLAVSISFMLIADIDSPRRGLINVRPQNLISLSQSLPH
jgi:hypothetical protein